MPLDTLNKVLKHKSLDYLNIPMNFFATLNGIVWFLISINNKSLPMTLANFLGLFSQFCLALSWLFVNDYIE
jgi:hypothetical protein